MVEAVHISPENGGDFLETLRKDKDVTRVIDDKELRAAFDLGHHLKHVDTIFGRVFGKPASDKKQASAKKPAAKKPKKKARK